jgi:hypothetical protein
MDFADQYAYYREQAGKPLPKPAALTEASLTAKPLKELRSIARDDFGLVGVGKKPKAQVVTSILGAHARRGMVSLEPLAKTVEAGIKAAKWTGESTEAAARWLWHSLARPTFKAARDALINRFGNAIRSRISLIWRTMRNWMRGEWTGKTPPGVFKSQMPVSQGLLDRFLGYIKQAKPIRKTFEEMKAAERIQRAKETHIAQRRFEGRASVHAAKRAQKGAFERPEQDFVPLRDQGMPEDQLNRLINHVNYHEVLRGKPDTRMALGSALESMWQYGHLPTGGELAWFDVIFGPKVVGALLKKRPTGVRGRELALEIWNAPKALKASWDLSATFRQGFFLTVTHPTAAARAMTRQLRAFGSEKVALKIEENIKSRDLYGLGKRSGLDLPTLGRRFVKMGEREEEFMSSIIQRIPGLRLLTRPSERAYVTYLNLLRSQVFDYWAKRAINVGITPHNNAAYFKQLAKFINAATGRGNMNFGDAAPWLNAAFFSPKLMVARFEYPYRLAKHGLLGPLRAGYQRATGAAPSEYMAQELMARFAARQMIASATFILGTAYLLDLARRNWGWDVGVELDPRSRRFLRARWGKRTDVDIAGGLGPQARIVTQIASGQTKDPHTGKIGKTSPIVASAYYLAGKAAPTPRVILNIRQGKRFGGKPLTIGGTAVDLVVPITFEQAYDSWQTHGAEGMWLMVPEVLGAGVYIEQEKKRGRTRPSRPSRPRRK